MQTTDDQTLNTLRTLKNDGVLRARNSKGEPLELDPAIASDLLSGEKLSLAPSSSNMIGASLESRRPVALPNLGSNGNLLRRGSQGVVSTACTDELMAKLSGDCETFNHNLVANFNEAKETMQKNFMQLFKRTSKEKLPDSFLRSLPKWGKGATKLHQVFNKSINRKQTDTLADQKDAPFELIIQPEILQEIDRDIHMLIDDELKRCVGENGPIIRDMQKILMQVTVLMERLRQLEDKIAKEETEMRTLQDRLHDERLLCKELNQNIEILTSEARDKELQMDILREQVQREREQSRMKRADFFKEICRYKTQLLHLTPDEHQEPGRPKSPRVGRERKESISEMRTPGEDAGFSMGADQADIQIIIEQKEKAWRQDHHEQVRALKIQHAEQTRSLQQQKKIACDERDEKNSILQARVKKLEFELVEEKRKLRRFLTMKDQE